MASALPFHLEYAVQSTGHCFKKPKKQKIMITKQETQYATDTANKKLVVVREFDASVDQVWNAWTDRELLDQWWAPRPWKARTKSMDFREGGSWLYAMIGPNGETHWSRADFKKIEPEKSFVGVDCFCDEQGIRNPELPVMHWTVTFSKIADGTKVEILIS